MLKNNHNFLYENKNKGVNIMETQDINRLSGSPAANQAPVSKVVVRRGPQLMVVFAGPSKAGDVEALLRAGVKVGLALTAGELAKASRLDDYSFVFVAMSYKAGSPLKQAVGDLAHNGWMIDDMSRAAYPAAPHVSNTPMRTIELAIA